jgi:hypothetical protein
MILPDLNNDEMALLEVALKNQLYHAHQTIVKAAENSNYGDIPRLVEFERKCEQLADKLLKVQE